MIIKNNFNNKSIDPLKDYNKIGRKEIDSDENPFIKDNVNNDIIKDIIKKDHEYEEDDNDNHDNWDFFR